MKHTLKNLEELSSDMEDLIEAKKLAVIKYGEVSREYIALCEDLNKNPIEITLHAMRRYIERVIKLDYKKSMPDIQVIKNYCRKAELSITEFTNVVMSHGAMKSAILGDQNRFKNGNFIYIISNRALLTVYHKDSLNANKKFRDGDTHEDHY